MQQGESSLLSSQTVIWTSCGYWPMRIGRYIIVRPRLLKWLTGGLRATPVAGPEPVDEYGYPLAWRHERPVVEAPTDDSDWILFTLWCQAKGERAFPTRPRVLLRYLQESSGDGSRFAVWQAVWRQHDSRWWHTAAIPNELLRLGGVTVLETGELINPQGLSWSVGPW